MAVGRLSNDGDIPPGPQEVIYVTYVERLPSSTKNLINVAASGFPDLPQKAKIFVDSNIPCTTWVFEVEGKIWVAMDGQTQLLVLNICTAAVNQISSVETGGKPTYIYMYIHTIQTPIFKLQLYLLFWRLVKALWRL